jgi:hypothetical protein
MLWIAWIDNVRSCITLLTSNSILRELNKYTVKQSANQTKTKSKQSKLGESGRGNFKCPGDQWESRRLILSPVQKFSGNQHFKRREILKLTQLLFPSSYSLLEEPGILQLWNRVATKNPTCYLWICIVVRGVMIIIKIEQLVECNKWGTENFVIQWSHSSYMLWGKMQDCRKSIRYEWETLWTLIVCLALGHFFFFNLGFCLGVRSKV